MLKEIDAYGTEGIPRTSEEEAKIERETEMEPGPNGEPSVVALKIDKSAKTITLYDRETNEILLHASIADYEKLLTERELRRRLGKSGQKEN
ncbi:MAG: hypothetical protein Q7S36_01175 [Candidatus Liptonbacteria bacterium]|nr:hypothetical protein [Candidatus Liptonbacteria bacterium]